MVKERPILFSAPMVLAILDGRKTQTRRILKNQPVDIRRVFMKSEGLAYVENAHGVEIPLEVCKFGKPVDRLWVRETYALVPRTAYAHSDGVQQMLKPDDNHDAAIYRAGWERSEGGIRWRPSIHMPRWACRIDLEITGVRVERLQDISEGDARAEGVPGEEEAALGCNWYEKPRRAYRRIWSQINGEASWNENPYVWVIEFKRL
jgi:hypothetical protein